MKRKILASLVLILLFAPAFSAHTASFFAAKKPTITSVNLSNTTVSTVGPNNAGVVVAAVSVTTRPPGGTYAGVITLGGANASSFTLTPACAASRHRSPASPLQR